MLGIDTPIVYVLVPSPPGVEDPKVGDKNFFPCEDTEIGDLQREEVHVLYGYICRMPADRRLRICQVSLTSKPFNISTGVSHKPA